MSGSQNGRLYTFPGTVKLWESPGKAGGLPKGIYRLVAAVRVGDADYAVKLTVKEVIAPEGRQSNFYTHELAGVSIEQTKRRGVSTANFGGRNAQLTASPRIDYTVGELVEAVNTNDKDSTPENPAIPTEFSKILDANEEPLVAYHATDNDFTVFNQGRLGEFTDQNATNEVASQMARLGFWFSDHDIREQTAQENVKAVWLNIKNPYQTSFEELWEVLEGQTADEFIAGLEKEGFDGIILDDTEFGCKSFVAFRSNQAKSATDNTGAFDPENPDIRYSFADNPGTTTSSPPANPSANSNPVQGWLDRVLSNAGPKWQDRWERFVYNFLDTNDPRERVWVAAESEAFREKMVKPILATLAKATTLATRAKAKGGQWPLQA